MRAPDLSCLITSQPEQMNRTRQAQPRAPAEDGRGGKGAALSERTQAYEN